MADGADLRGSESGFTLLELLVVVTILGLILVALSGGVRFAGQAWQAQETRAVRQGDLDAVQNVLRELISSGNGFQGTRGSLRFVARLPDALARGGLYDVELHAAGDRVLLSWRPHFKGSMQTAETADAELVKDVADLDIAYFSAAGGWQPAQQNKAKPPALIRVALRLNDGRSWTPLIIAPMVDFVTAVAN
jgi:general secretion pathway protein J